MLLYVTIFILFFHQWGTLSNDIMVRNHCVEICRSSYFKLRPFQQAFSCREMISNLKYNDQEAQRIFICISCQKGFDVFSNSVTFPDTRKAILKVRNRSTNLPIPSLLLPKVNHKELSNSISVLNCFFFA